VYPIPPGTHARCFCQLESASKNISLFEINREPLYPELSLKFLKTFCRNVRNMHKYNERKLSNFNIIFTQMKQQTNNLQSTTAQALTSFPEISLKFLKTFCRNVRNMHKYNATG
jgi:hypothetical protein